jgi:hypothetical protein
LFFLSWKEKQARLLRKCSAFLLEQWRPGFDVRGNTFRERLRNCKRNWGNVMSDPQRLLGDSQLPAFQRELLASWKKEGPDPKLRTKVLVSCGLVASMTTAVSGGASAGMATLLPKVAAGGLFWLKLGGVAVVVAGASAGIVLPKIVGHKDATLSANVVSSSVVENALNFAKNESATPSATVASAPVASAEDPPPALSAHSALGPHAATSNVAEQLVMLDEARALLRAGQAAQSLRLIERYESQFRGGAFYQEAEVLRIEALVRQGNRDSAMRLGRRFIDNNPKSPHAARIRSLLGL